jgi:branched-chain amino acid transport system substrate-binding protein
LLPLVTCGLLVAACLGKDVREVAVLAPLSGDGSAYGEAIVHGATLAVEELGREHEQGTYPHRLELTVLDTKGDPGRAAELLRRAYEDGAAVAIGGVTDAEVLAMAPVADEERRVLISPSSSTPELAGVSRYVFRVSPSGPTEGTKMASFARRELGLDRVALASAETGPRSGALEAFRAEVERHRGEIVAEVGFAAGAGDLAASAKAVREGDPQAIYVTGAAARVARFVETLRAAGYPGVVMTTGSFAVGEVLSEPAGAEGVLLSRPLFDPDGDEPAARSFAKAYEERFGTAPGIHAAYAYDSVRVLAAALAQAGDARPAALWSALRAVRDLRGLTGFLQFDEGGEVASFPRIYVVRDGELVEYGELEAGEQRRIARQVARLGASPSPLAG